MGVCGSSSKKDMFSQVCPSDPDHLSIERQYEEQFKPTHPSNLNKKYDYLYKVDESQTVGKNIKKTAGYFSKVPVEIIHKKRKEFWETRIEGATSTWEALKFACESDDPVMTVSILKAAGVKLMYKSLQMSYDDQNFRYDIPIFVINDPTSCSQKKGWEPFDKKDIKVVSF